MPPNGEIVSQQCSIHSRSRVYDTRHLKIYLNTQLARYEYLRLKIFNLPKYVIEQYGLKYKTTSEGYIYVEIRKGMYGLPQADLLAQELLEQILQKQGYTQSKLTPGFCTHAWRPISFTLVVDE